MRCLSVCERCAEDCGWEQNMYAGLQTAKCSWMQGECYFWHTAFETCTSGYWNAVFVFYFPCLLLSPVINSLSCVFLIMPLTPTLRNHCFYLNFPSSYLPHSCACLFPPHQNRSINTDPVLIISCQNAFCTSALEFHSFSHSAWILLAFLT